MTFDEACGVKNPHGISHNEKYKRYLGHIGLENVRPYLPAGIPELARAYVEDRDFNTIPLPRWEKAAGYSGRRDSQGQQPETPAGPFPRMLARAGITLFSSSECVCLLKHAAEQLVLERLLAAQDLKSLECWAVFERWNSRPDRLSRHNIFDHDCVAIFPTESEAMAFEQENPEHRVRKLIHDTRRKEAQDGAE
ncbi:MAG: hypothetical protein NC311_09995 [Muribaculaceae bacterium]|nr:hypothetical protein [Muribaculaceae bacterium]